MGVNIDKLGEAIDALKTLLKSGLVGTDIWDTSSGLGLASYQANATAAALLNELTQTVRTTLDSSGLPGLGRFYLMDLENNVTCIIIRHGDDLMQSIMVDNQKVNLGVATSVAIPKMIEIVGS